MNATDICINLREKLNNILTQEIPDKDETTDFIKSCLDYTSIFKIKTEKFMVIRILYEFLSSEKSKEIMENKRFRITVKNKLQEMINNTDDNIFQTELLTFQRKIDPDLFYLNKYIKKTFNCYLHFYYNQEEKLCNY